MLKYFLAIIAVILFSVSHSSANTHGGGIKAGLLISSPSGSDRDLYAVESINSFTGGVFYRYTFTRFSIQTEWLYAHKGSKGKYYYSEGQVNIWYFDFTSSLQYKIVDNSNLFSWVYIGPMLSKRINANVERELFGTKRTYDIDSDTKSFDYGFIVGAKFGLPYRSNEFGIDLRYSSGFIAPDDTGSDIDLNNRTITVMLEMYFGKE